MNGIMEDEDVGNTALTLDRVALAPFTETVYQHFHLLPLDLDHVLAPHQLLIVDGLFQDALDELCYELSTAQHVLQLGHTGVMSAFLSLLMPAMEAVEAMERIDTYTHSVELQKWWLDNGEWEEDEESGATHLRSALRHGPLTKCTIEYKTAIESATLDEGQAMAVRNALKFRNQSTRMAAIAVDLSRWRFVRLENEVVEVAPEYTVAFDDKKMPNEDELKRVFRAMVALLYSVKD